MARLTAPISQQTLIKTLRKTHGNIYGAASLLGISRQAVYQRIRKSKKLQALVEEEREARLDLAERALDAATLRGEAWAVTLTLKTIGKSRGYIERNEISGPDSEPITIKVERVGRRDDAED